MKRVIFVHRWSGDALGDWRAWAKEELEKQGYEVHAPNMPEAETPEIEKWIGKLAEVVGVPDEDTYFVGHSIGCQTIMRYMETINAKVGGAVFVSGWFNLDNLEYGDIRRTAKAWLETPIDLNKVRKSLPKSTLIISDNSPYGYFEENKAKFEELGSKIVVLHKAGHISDVGGFTKLPVLLEELDELIKDNEAI